MPTIHFVLPDGSRRSVKAPAGTSLMEAARQNRIPGVIAQCGGACVCATCHVYVDPAWLGRLEPPDDMEAGMLESAWEPRASSRLACQVPLSDALDGMVARVPARQAG